MIRENSKEIQCEVKSKYRGHWERRKIIVDYGNNHFIIENPSGKRQKVYSLSSIQFSARDKESDNKIEKFGKLHIPDGRKYQLKLNKHNYDCLAFINQYPKVKSIDQMVEESIPPLITLNYYTKVRPYSLDENLSQTYPSQISLFKSKKQLEDYERFDSYIKLDDWKIDPKKGGLFFINEEKKSNISKIVKYIVKRVVSSGSFMGISFPSFAMKPETILETYCKCLGAVPLILKNISNDPVQRMKAFTAIIPTISLQFTDIDKSFNPVIGQTFQGHIGGYEVFAEQVCHHPPISTFMLYGQDYILYSSLQLSAKLGINSAVGLFYGQICLEFNDGAVIKGKMPNGMMQGVLFGDTTFNPIGAVYAYDPENNLVASYEQKEKDIMRGFIGKLKPKSETHFYKTLESVSRFDKFKNLSKGDYLEIKSTIQLVWTRGISFDNVLFWDYDKPENLPIKLSTDIPNKLKSDSTFRKDIQMRAKEEMDNAQVEKERIEQEQRRLRKLRNEHKNKGKEKSDLNK